MERPFAGSADQERRWVEGAIIYHIYPRSFQDTNGDGIGDLPGVTQHLDYLKSLGATGVWLSPFYPSPMADFGYDISDYQAVDPQFGTMDDCMQLLDAAHQRDLRVMIDLVPNHTSDEHAWFQASRQSRDNPYADWYIWRDARGSDTAGNPLPPNNWLDALTGESAWAWDPSRQQFYLHSFHAKQPDLNWDNPAVHKAFQEIMRFWLDRGVDGFRVDAVYWMGKDPTFRDDAPNPAYVEGQFERYEQLLHNNSRAWPAVFSHLSAMADVLREEKYRGRQPFMVTEAYPDPANKLEAYLAFYANIDPEVSAPFNFEGVLLPWDAGQWRTFLHDFHARLAEIGPECVPSYSFGNHDKPRLIDRLGSVEAARSAAVMLLTLPGMAFMYYGDEIGMHNVHIPPEAIQDPAARGAPIGDQGRDPERTPMQWSAAANAGFTTAATPWLPVAPDYPRHNVAVESDDPGSMLSLYRRLGQLRTEHEALKYGSFEIADAQNEHVVAFIRRAEQGSSFAVLINFADIPAACRPPVLPPTAVLSSDPTRNLESFHNATFSLNPHEAVILSFVSPNDGAAK